MTTLAEYESAVYNLIQAPSSSVPLIPAATIDLYINTARQQLASDAECSRFPGFLSLVPGQRVYSFNAITANAYAAVVSTPISVRLAQISNFMDSGGSIPILSGGGGTVISVGPGQVLQTGPGTTPSVSRIDIRSWEWFSNYYLSDLTTGVPIRMAQQGQGSFGTLFFDPVPNATFSVTLDVVWLPALLVNAGDIEGAIPLMWSDAVSFYAAWLAFMSLQRQSDANVMLGRYKELARRGRQETTPSVLPINFPGDVGTKEAASKTTLTGMTEAARQ